MPSSSAGVGAGGAGRPDDESADGLSATTADEQRDLAPADGDTEIPVDPADYPEAGEEPPAEPPV